MQKNSYGWLDRHRDGQTMNGLDMTINVWAEFLMNLFIKALANGQFNTLL